jgi:autotransporter-associated beta strand protein
MDLQGITRNWLLVQDKTCALVALGVCFLLPIGLRAQTTWNGTTNTVWNTGTNWSGGVPAAGTAAVFGTSSNYNLTFSAAAAALGLTFNSGVSNGYTFANNGYTLTIYGSGITNNNNLTQSFSAPVATAANQTWNATSGGLTFGAVTLSNTLTLAGASSISITGTLTNSTGNRTITNNITSPAGATFNNINLSEGNTGRTLTISGTGTTIVSGVMADGGSGAGALSKTGTGTLVLSGGNTYTGATTVSAGVLNIQNNTALGTTAGATTVASGASLQVQGGITVTGEALTLSGTGVSATGALRNISGDNTWAGTVSLAANSQIQSDLDLLTISGAVQRSGATSRALTVSGSGDVAITGTIANTITTVTKLGSGTLTLSNTANAYTGTTTIGAANGASGGTLMLGASSVLPGTAVTVFAGTLDLNSYSNTIGALTLGGGAAGTTAVVNTETGALTLGGNVTYTATNNPNGAAINGNLALGGANRTFTIGDSTAATADLTVNAVISGANAITKAGAGTLVLSGANTYTGATTISAGVLDIQNNSALGTNIAGASVTSGAALQMENNITVSGEALTLNGTGVSTGGALRNISGNNSWTGAITLGAATRINSDAGTLTLSGNIGGASGLTVGGAGATTISGAIGTGAGTLIKDGTGTLTLSGANTYTGATTISGGVLSVSSLANGGAASNIGQAAVAATNLVLNGGTLQYTGSGSTTNRLFSVGAAGGTIDSSGTGVLNFNGAGSMAFNGVTGARTLTLTGSNTANNTIAAVIGDNTGATSLTKSGAGTWVLSGANTYTGVTTVSGGTLSVSSLANGGATSNIGRAAVAATNLVLDGGTLQYTGSGATTNRLFSVGAGGGTIDASGAGALNFNGAGSMGFNGASGARTLTLTGSNTGNNTLAAVVGDNGGATSLTKSGAGNWVLSGANTYTGATTVSAGTLTLGSNENMSGSLVLAGGTLNLGGFSGTFNSLSVTANSIIDFGTGGASILNILTSVTVDSGATLTINNWTDSVDYFYSLYDPGAVNLGRISFSGYSPTAANWQSFDHDISPVPESPVFGAVLMALGLILGLVAARHSRRSNPSYRR